MKKPQIWATVWVVSLMLAFIWSCSPSNTPPLLGKETIKGWLSDPQVMIIDVRAAKDWDPSHMKIKGAVRQDPNEVKTWAANLPRDQKIVLY